MVIVSELLPTMLKAWDKKGLPAGDGKPERDKLKKFLIESAYKYLVLRTGDALNNLGKQRNDRTISSENNQHLKMSSYNARYKNNAP